MYKRVLLKLSGESLGGPAGKGLETASLSAYAKEIAAAAKAGLQIAIVNGGGNIFRGLQGVGKGFDRVDGDKMGMLATVINSLALSMFIKEEGVEAQVFTATPMEPVAKYYMRDDAVKVLERGGVALIAGGTGNPFFTTDSGAALRALEIAPTPSSRAPASTASTPPIRKRTPPPSSTTNSPSTRPSPSTSKSWTRPPTPSAPTATCPSSSST